MNKLLIVEDDTLLSDMIKRLLIQNNYDVSNAYSGSEALLLLEKNSFDIIGFNVAWDFRRRSFRPYKKKY